MLNFAIKSEVITISFDKPKFAENADLACLKADFDKVDVDKLKNVPNYLSKSSNVVEKDVVKKTGYNFLVKKVLAIISDKQNLEKNIENVDKKILEN